MAELGDEASGAGEEAGVEVAEGNEDTAGGEAREDGGHDAFAFAGGDASPGESRDDVVGLLFLVAGEVMGEESGVIVVNGGAGELALEAFDVVGVEFEGDEGGAAADFVADGAREGTGAGAEFDDGVGVGEVASGEHGQGEGGGAGGDGADAGGSTEEGAEEGDVLIQFGVEGSGRGVGATTFGRGRAGARRR